MTSERHIVDGVQYLCHTDDHYCPEWRCCDDPRCKGCGTACDNGGQHHDDEFDESLEVNVCKVCGRESPSLGAGETRVGP